jgi:23S rRNA (adenine1618-N6)-methyltransferase
MCNPPFYGSREDMIATAAAKEKPPFSVRKGNIEVALYE